MINCEIIEGVSKLMGEARKGGPIIIISGQVGSGKSTLARLLAEELGYRYLSAGAIFREMAREMGLSLEELHEVAESDPNVDLEVDGRIVKEAINGNVVVDGHIVAWLLKDVADVRIYLKAPLEMRARRLIRRDGRSLEEALNEIEFREASNSKRGKEIYGVDLGDTSFFDAIIDTGQLDVNGALNVISMFIRRKLALHDC